MPAIILSVLIISARLKEAVAVRASIAPRRRKRSAISGTGAGVEIEEVNGFAVLGYGSGMRVPVS